MTMKRGGALRVSDGQPGRDLASMGSRARVEVVEVTLFPRPCIDESVDEELLAFLSMRVAEDEQRAERQAWDWVDGHAHWVDERARQTADVRRGLVETADRLSRNKQADIATAGDHIIRLLASLYGNHPEYRQHWRPRFER
jgi:hypothetical protein